jgi:4-amino-4-deoxy-L-arabinose transferase-like glycosyltransferase
VAEADAVTVVRTATAAKAAEADTVIEASPATAAKADAEADTVIGSSAATAAAAGPDATTVVTTIGKTATPVPAESTQAGPTTTEPPAPESPDGGATGVRVAGPNAPTLPRGTRPEAEVTTTLSRAELKAAMVQARTLEAVESIEAIDALECTTLGSLEAQTAKARKTVEAISVLEARTAQAMKAIEAMTANAFEAIEARVAEMTPELTGTLAPPDQAAQADEADADEAETPAAEGADRGGPPPAEAAPPGSAGDAASSPGTDVARTRVIHLDEPPPSVTLTTSSTETIIAVPQPRGESLVAVAPVPATTTAPLPLTPAAEPPALPAAEPQPEAEPQAKPRRARWSRRTRISRILLLCILAIQAILSLRLHNTAFEDEALYLYSGHNELEHLLHGAVLQGSYASYFSGSPVLYPVAAGFLNQLGGLTAARMLSLAEMLSVTALLYSLTRRLFNERAGLCAALLFAVTESAVFLGNFATYDATCLFLLAYAAWIMVRTAGFRWPVFVLAAPVAALAVGVKYAGLLFVPTIAVLPALAGYPLRGRRVLLYPPIFVAAVGGLLYGALKLGGHAYTAALSSTTTQRAQGLTPVSTLLKESAGWGGVIFVLAVIGTVAYVWHIRTEPEEVVAPAGGRFRRLSLGVILTGTALLAPAYQAHLHTDISFQKHIGFGLFFAAPLAGLGLARVLGDHLRRPHVAVGIGSLALVLGVVQSTHLYHVWPNSTQFVRAFSQYLKPHAKYLVEVPEVPIYYLQGRPGAQPSQFISTFYINYRNSKGVLLTGPVGFTAAVDAGYFHEVAYNGDVTPAADGALATALSASKAYYLAAEIQITDVLGPSDYYIWVKGHRPEPTGVFVHTSSKYQDLGTKIRELAP